MPAHCRDDFVDDGVVRLLARVHDDVGLRIDRLALRQQLLDLVGERTIATAFGPLDEHVEVGFEPYRNAFDMDEVARVLVDDRPTSGRQYLRAVFQEPRDHARLARAKIRLPVFGEDFGDGHAGRTLDLGVRVDKRNAQSAGEPTTYRGFPSPHHANQHDRPATKRPHERLHRGPIGGVLCRFLSHGVAHARLPKSPLTVPYISDWDNRGVAFVQVAGTGRRPYGRR